MKQIYLKMRSTDGDVSVLFVVIVLVFMLLMAATTQLIKPFMIVTTVNGAMQQASNDVAAQNSYTLYGGVREGNNSVAEYNGRGSWNTASLNTAVVGRLKELLKLTGSGDKHEQIGADGLVSYGISNVLVVYTAPARASGEYHRVITTLTLHIPLRVPGQREPITTVQLPMKIRTKYTPLF